MAPEVLSTTDRYIPSGDGGKAADIYSFAMVMFEVCLSRIYLQYSNQCQRLTLTADLDRHNPVSG